ncbi:MAG: GNAT family N-acetyltransferase [Alphaproteobacteria bacterium]|nr:GNAT family N-acetyltransferase [Alphaproteobacteria bacterium]
MNIKFIRYNTPEYHQQISLRNKILRAPLGLILTPEDIKQEKNDLFLAYFHKNQIIGGLVLTKMNPKTLKLRQMAIDLNYQKQGLGKALVLFAEQYAQINTFKEIELNARYTAINFYKKLQYQIISDTFIEVGLPHQKMLKQWVID